MAMYNWNERCLTSQNPHATLPVNDERNLIIATDSSTCISAVLFIMSRKTPTHHVPTIENIARSYTYEAKRKNLFWRWHPKALAVQAARQSHPVQAPGHSLDRPATATDRQKSDAIGKNGDLIQKVCKITQ